MRFVAEVYRGETSVGPVAIDGRTITFVARTRGLRIGRDARLGALHVRARPAHVEILDTEGRRQVVRIHDLERTMIAAISLGGLACAFAVRALRGRRSAGKATR